VKRFWSRVNVLGPKDCWEWQGGKANSGHGRFWFDGKQIPAHRAAYLIEVGEIPEGLNVCHSCDNPPCVNPRHLWLGTQAENLQDMCDKGRHVGCRKLTEDDVRAIRASNDSSADLAKHYGMTYHAIWAVRAHRTWRAVT
jgi:hypothetical protein